MKKDLPDGWSMKALKDVCEIVLGQSPPGNTYNESGEGLPFFQGKAEFGELSPTPRKWCTAPKKVTEAGDVLVSVRAPVGPTNLSVQRAAIGRGLAAIRPPEGMSPKYLLYALRATEHRFSGKTTGSTFEAITGPVLKAHEIPVAPEDEQALIVDEIEKQLTRVEAAVAYLQRARPLLYQFRERAMTFDNNEEQLVPLGELLAEALANGRSLPTDPDGFPVLRLTSLKDGRIDATEKKGGAWSRDDALRFLMRENDFLISRGSGSLSLVGRGGLVGPVTEEVAYPDTMIRARVDSERISPHFLRLIWDTRLVRAQVERVARTTAGIYKVNQQDLSRVEVPVPSVDDQLRFVAAADRQLSFVKQLQNEISVGLRRAEQLRQSILLAAFAGLLESRSGPSEQVPA